MGAGRLDYEVNFYGRDGNANWCRGVAFEGPDGLPAWLLSSMAHSYSIARAWVQHIQ